MSTYKAEAIEIAVIDTVREQLGLGTRLHLGGGDHVLTFTAVELARLMHRVAESRRVWVVLQETNDGEQIGFVEAIYATEALAEQARRAGLRAYRDCAMGRNVWTDPDNPEHEDHNWDTDLTVFPRMVQQAAPTHACTYCGALTVFNTNPRAGIVTTSIAPGYRCPGCNRPNTTVKANGAEGVTR